MSVTTHSRCGPLFSAPGNSFPEAITILLTSMQEEKYTFIRREKLRIPCAAVKTVNYSKKMMSNKQVNLLVCLSPDKVTTNKFTSAN